MALSFMTRSRVLLIVTVVLSLNTAPAWAGLREGSRTVDGLTVYLGVVPASITRGHAPAHVEAKMHGGVRAASPHNVHIVAAVFDAASGKRRTDVRVMARLHGRGTKQWTVPLNSMTIAGATSYGGYTSIGWADDLMISIDIIRPNRTPRTRTTTMQFEYAHD